LLLAIKAEKLRRKTGINSISYSGRKLNIGFKKPKIEGTLSLGDVSSDIYGSWERMGFEDERNPRPVWGFMLKFRW
jgi:hypothetical protein